MKRFLLQGETWWAACLAFLSGCSGAAAGTEPATEVAAITTLQSPMARVASRPLTSANVESLKLRWEALPGGFARAVAVSGRLGRVVFNSDQGTHVFDLASGKAQGRLETCKDVVRGGMFFYETKLLLVCRDAVEWHSVTEAKKLGELEVSEAAITAAALSGHRVALAHHDGVVRVHDLESGQRIDIVVPGPPIDVKSLALDATGSRLAVAWIQGSVWWWELDRPNQFHKLVRNESESDSVAFAASGLLAEEGRSGFTTLWKLARDAPAMQTHEIRNGAWIKRLLFTQDGEWLVRGGSDGLDLAEVGGPKRLVLDTAGQVEDVAMDEQGSVIASGDRVGRLMVFAPR